MPCDSRDVECGATSAHAGIDVEHHGEIMHSSKSLYEPEHVIPDFRMMRAGIRES